jgi:hypothetical protein
LAQINTYALPGLLKFYTRDEVRKYLHDLVGYYQGQVDSFGETLGTLMRSGQDKTSEEKRQNKQSQEKSKVISKGWMRMGTLLVNLGDPLPAITEVSLQLLEEFKAKLAKTTDAMKSFEDQANTVIPENATYRLYLHNGVPERILIEPQEARRETFGFSAQFQLV